jgi:hypothetical protein
MFILLVELYSRTLLTLGDDEFHTPGSRNPLTVDEVIGFSALLRNVAFALYWQETQVNIKKALVSGTRATYEYLRSLATALLQQIHVRESVHFLLSCLDFAPPSFAKCLISSVCIQFSSAIYATESLDHDEPV